MKFLELDADKLNAAIATWTGAWEVESLKAILDNNEFGNAASRLEKATYYGVTLDGSLIATVQIAMHGGGKLKTIKLTDLLIRSDLSDIQQLTVLVKSVGGVISLASGIVEDGGSIRTMKIYGRTSVLFDGLKSLLTEISDAFGKAGINVSMEGRWLAFSPSQQ
jgi:hypothetical protein